MELHNFKYDGQKYIQVNEYLNIAFLNEFSSPTNVKNFIRMHKNEELKIEQFDFLLHAEDSHIRAAPKIYPYFKPLDLIPSVNILKKLTKQFIETEKYDSIIDFLQRSESNNYFVQAMIS